ncbi:MAG: hypothetical protein P4L57_16160 [Rhizomicrobium sp.]|nr:hypothetical protein [Rhizomicrobium sp.]
MMRLVRSGGMWAFIAGLVCLFAFGAMHAADSSLYVIHNDHWTDDDEHGYQTFITALGESDCASLNECLHSAANPYSASEPVARHFEADCAELPYVLRFYYAWKRGLPFSYVDAVAPRDGSGDDIRYSHSGNRPTSRRDVPGGRFSGMQVIAQIRSAVSSASYRIHPDIDGPLAPDFYSPAIAPASIHPETMVYDPAGHVAIVYKIDPDGQIHSFDAHTDFSLTTITFDVRFARTRPSQGAGFKNWRPLRLVHGEKQADGTWRGGVIVPARNSEIADFSREQFYGTGKAPKEENWASGAFNIGGETLDYYDFVRARLAGGKLIFDPLKDVEEMTRSVCSDLQYRAAAVALAQPLAGRAHPARLPRNIYGSEGDWEFYSTPSRDARLKTEFKHLRDTVQRFVELQAAHDTRHLHYQGEDLAGDISKIYRRNSESCSVAYRKSDGSMMRLSFEDVRQRLFALSFDPYHCPERRWGASDAELSICKDDAVKANWYAAEQPLRNQIERRYDARMDFSLDEMGRSSIGVPVAPDTDVLGYLSGLQKQAEN